MQNEAANYLLDSLIFLLGTTLLFLHLAHKALDSVLHKASDGHRTYATWNGSDSRSLGLDGCEIHITTQLLSLGIAVNTYVDNHSALLNHISRNKLRTTDSYNQDICAACYLGQVLGAAMSADQP